MKDRIDELRREWTAAREQHPRIVYSVLAGSGLLAAFVLGAALMFLINLPKGLPDDAALSKIGEMDQATAVFDSSNALAFTIYKEQRIEVPLDQISPLMIKALIATEDQRFYEHGGFDLRRIA